MQKSRWRIRLQLTLNRYTEPPEDRSLCWLLYVVGASMWWSYMPLKLSTSVWSK